MLKTVIDQMGRWVNISSSVFRIVSLVPSQTELLVDLGLRDQIVGVTKFCIHPSSLRKQVQVIGGTKKLDIDKIIALNPDIVIGNKEENEKSDIEALIEHVPVWMSDITDQKSALEMIRGIGEVTNSSENAEKLIASIQIAFRAIDSLELPQRKVLYLIWKDPYFAAGSGTFIADYLSLLNWTNCVTDPRYPEVDLVKADPDIVLLSSEPFPFDKKHLQEINQLVPKAKVYFVDGEMFSWYGSRMIQAPNYFKTLVEGINRDIPS
jgi:ABC-type Fe3+-hydroxamate transport system substrate-binding protein